jgi:hypothetical protein
MLPVHVTCRQGVTFKTVIADDGTPALVWWCQACAMALNETDCDPPKFYLEDVPVAAVAELADALASDSDTEH